VRRLTVALTDPTQTDRNGLLARFGELISQADNFDPLVLAGEGLECDSAVYQGVWKQAAALRASGQLLQLGRQIRCPVVAIHGAFDPHPAEGVRIPLSTVLSDFKFFVLEKCGHCPWKERAAKNEFYRLLEEELS
jgi:pimeloyl-ACP methyl ester carboxylesterase